VAEDPDATAVEDGEDPEGSDEAEDDESVESAAQAAARRGAYGRRGSADPGGIEDLTPDGSDDVRDQMLAGSRANLDIAEIANPGFQDTQVVNRMGLVLSLNLSYDYDAGQWVPDPIDETEEQALSNQLSEDRATDDLSGSVDTDDSTTVDSNGDLKLDPGTETENDIKDSPDGTNNTKGQPLFQWDNGPAEGEVTGTFDDSAPANPKCELGNVTKNTTSDFIDMSTPEFAVPFSGDPGDEWSIRVYRQDEDYWDANEYLGVSTPLSTDFGDAWGKQGVGDSTGDFYAVDKVGAPDPAEEGTATSTFDNPCTATAVKQSQHDVCSRTADVRVDLYHGDPLSSDSTLLARDIGERESLPDIPPSLADLQYKITLTRDPNGDTPKVSRLGHQIIR
jgi:hypothetical protein